MEYDERIYGEPKELTYRIYKPSEDIIPLETNKESNDTEVF